MSSHSIAFQSASELAAEIAAGRLTSAALTEMYLERIEQYDERLHAFVTVYADDARAAAAAADLAIQAGHRIGPLHGLPVAVKDIIDIAGRVTTGGSQVWADRVSPVTAKLVRHLIAAGMIVIGKTHTVEFAMGSFGTNRHRGTPWNPWDIHQHRIPGGSSSGSAVSVAAGLAPWAVGTDTGGSVRIPAAFCGLVGLKTTVGQISCDGILPLSATLDTPGPLCRSVEDAALLYRVLAGGNCKGSPPSGLDRGVAGLRFARLPQSEREGVDAEVLAAYDDSLALLAGLGAHLTDISLPRSFQQMGDHVGRIIGAEGYSVVGHLVENDSLPIDDDVRPRILIGRDMRARDYLLALREQQALKAAFNEAMAEIDALLTPTTTYAALPVNAVDQSGTAAFFTRPVNLVEGCALALPNGHTSEGLPTSLQVVCPGDQEGLALRIGFAFQQARNWTPRQPAGFD